MNQQLTDNDLVKILVTGLMRSIAILEDFILRSVEPSMLNGEYEKRLLNQVKERKNTGKHPIEIYLKPEDVA